MLDDARDKILSRIQKNLAVFPSTSEFALKSIPLLEVQRSAIPRRQEDKSLTALFEEELTLIGGKLIKVNSKEELYASLRNVFKKENYRNVILSRERFLDELQLEDGLQSLAPGTILSRITDRDVVNQLKSADVGVTTCEFLAAETGTIVLHSSPTAPRTLSLLPRAHVVIAREDQILPTVAACLEKIYDQRDKSTHSCCVTLISGPSRTADIEKVLVTGVHGPKELFVFLVLKSK